MTTTCFAFHLQMSFLSPSASNQTLKRLKAHCDMFSAAYKEEFNFFRGLKTHWYFIYMIVYDFYIYMIIYW